MIDPATTSAAPPPPARRALGWLVTLAAGVGVAEIGLRLLDWPPRPPLLDLVRPQPLDPDLAPDADTFWRVTPSSTRLRVNRLGLPGPDPDPKKTDRHFRIAVVGGGVACGVGVDIDDCFALRLERAAQGEASGARIDTLILGLPGFTTFQDLRLWQRHGPAFAPDLVIVYGGAWHDLAPAILSPDAIVAQDRARPDRWHLARWLRGLWSKRLLSPADLAALPPDAEPPNGRRVPVADFAHNVQAIVRGARAAGAEVCVVLPALAGDLEAKHKVVEEYRAALKQVAAAEQASPIDADQIVTAYEQSLPGPPCPEIGTSHGLRDGVHLSAPAHDLLAQLLLTRVRAHPRFAELAKTGATNPPAVTNVQPSTVEALAETEITVHGTGFQRASGWRLTIGDQSAAPVQVVNDQTLTARVPLELAPGRHALVLTSELGRALIPDDVTLSVNPAKLDAALQRDGEFLQVALSGRAAPGCRVQVWASATGRANAVDTPAGSWWLQFGALGGKPSRAPFCFGALPLPSVSTTPGADGAWQTTARWPAQDALAGPNAVFQGVVWMPHETGRAVATEVAVRVVPR